MTLLCSTRLPRAIYTKSSILSLKGLFDRVAGLGYTIKISTAAKDFITEKGYDVQYGARPLKRAIQKYLEDPPEALIKSDAKPGAVFLVGYSKRMTKLLFEQQKLKRRLPTPMKSNKL